MELKGENGVMWEIKDKQSKISIQHFQNSKQETSFNLPDRADIKKIIFINPSGDILLLIT